MKEIKHMRLAGVTMLAAAMFASTLFAYPNAFHPRHFGPRPLHYPRPVHYYHHHIPHNHHGSSSSAFWGGFAGSLIGSAVYDVFKLQPSPVVVTTPLVSQPTVIIQNQASSPKMVWIDGHYEDQVLSNGTVVKIWVPGKWVEVK